MKIIDYIKKLFTKKGEQYMSKKALLVGVNKYAMGGSDLNGCVNDVLNIRDILIAYQGFKADDIRVLTDNRATKNNIIERLNWLIKNAISGDKLVFHYSGHVSQIRDRNGDELVDGMDELICPHDMDWDNGTFIIDDDLQSIFKEVPNGVSLDVILDCCHSGTGTREIRSYNPNDEESSGKVITVRKSRYLQPPIDIMLRSEDDTEIRKILKPNDTKNSVSTENGLNTMTHSLIAGCMDNQTSADAYIGGNYNGALTYHLCKILRDHNGNISRENLIGLLKNSLKLSNFEQVPQLECPASKKLENLFT